MYGPVVPLLPLWHCGLAFALLFLGLPAISPAAASPQPSSQLYRGVAPADRPYFQGRSVRCRDGSKTLTLDRVNDDFCDCVDGTDEPGTAACPDGKFYCRNRGHMPLSIFSSRVNDGICDCCDGSDEYAGKVKCANTCAEAGAENLGKLREQVAKYKEGVKARVAYEDEAKTTREEWARDLEQLSAEEGILKKHVERLAEQKAAVEKVEREEREWKERMEREKEEAERKKREEEEGATKEGQPASETVSDTPQAGAESSANEGTEGGGDPPMQPEDVHVFDPIASPAEAVEEERREVAEAEGSTEGTDPVKEDESNLSAEELGARIRARWTGGGGSTPPPPSDDDQRALEAEREMHEHDHDLEDDDDHHLPEDDFHDERDAGSDYDPERDADYDDHDDFDDNEPYKSPSETTESPSTQESSPPATETTPAATTWWSRMIGSSSKLFKMFSSRPPAIDITEAEGVKQQHKEANDRYQKVMSDIKKLKKQLKLNYGKGDVFLKLYKKCFEFAQKQYIYKICLFDTATQLEGHITSRLGDWQEIGKDNVDTLYFKNGDRCWNGPERSMTVKMLCGSENKLLSVEEPSRCEYEAHLVTPVVCSESEAQALIKELEERESELKASTTGHDELR